MSKDLLYKVAYDEAARALSEQQGVIDSLRNRAGLLFSVAAISTSFLGAQAFQGDHSNLASWMALLCFVAVATASLAVLWPRKWEGAVNSHEVIKAYIEPARAAPVEELHRDLSIYMHDSYLENRESFKQLAALLQVASGLLVLEIALWIIAIAARF